MLQSRVHAADLRVALGVEQAGKAVAGIAPDALRFARVVFVEHDAERDVEGLVPERQQIVVELLNARLVGDGGMREVR